MENKSEFLLWTTIVVVFILLAVVGYYLLSIDESPSEESMPIATVSFEIGDEHVNFTCEVASTPENRSLGLMHREELAMDKGMIFVFDSPNAVNFWMKNTLIPLDMIFIDENGVVTNVEEANPEPGVPDGELTVYYSDGPVIWVVEVNQGISATYGIETGTHVYVDYSDLP